MSLPRPRRVFVESVPIAGIVLFWVTISWLGSHPLLGTGARLAGIVMALTYAVVRGISLATDAGPPPTLGDLGSVLRANGLAAVAAGGWFVGARLVVFVEQLWSELALPGAFTSPAEGIAFALTATGVATVVLYAVTLGTAAMRGETPRENRSVPTGSPTND